MTTLVAVSFTVTDLDRLSRTFEDRGLMRERYGCISSRLFTSADAPNRLLSLLEFPSERIARNYIAAVRLQLDPEQHADVRICNTEYFHSFAEWDAEAVEQLDASTA